MHSPQAKSQFLTFAKLDQIDLFIVLALLGLSPLIALQCYSLWMRPHLQFFPLAWAAFVYLISIRCPVITTTENARWIEGIGLATTSLLVSLAAMYFSSPWIAYVAAVVAIIAWMILRLASTKRSSVYAFSTILWITVPLPVGYDGKLIQLLQEKSSVAASLVLDALGILHLREGNILELTSKRLFVDEACSGIDSLYALMAICLSVVIWFRQPFAVGALSLCLVPLWASMSNLTRLVAIAVGIDRFALDLSHGTSHTLLGMIVFAGAFFVDFCFIQFAGAAFLKWRTQTHTDQMPTTHTSTAAPMVQPFPNHAPRRSREHAIMITLGVGMLLLGGYTVWAFRTKSFHRLPQFDSLTLARLADASKLPTQLVQSTLVRFHTAERNVESAFGQHSHIWTYQSPYGQFTLSTDFPFRGFHALHQCYQSSGWNLDGEPDEIELDLTPSQSNGLQNVVAHEISLNKPDGEHAYLLYALFTLDGKQQTSQAKGNRGYERLEQTIFEPVTFQVQLLQESPSKLDAIARDHLRKEFVAALPELKKSFKDLNVQSFDD